jgi:hypothetical protein
MLPGALGSARYVVATADTLFCKLIELIDIGVTHPEKKRSVPA